VKAKIVLRARNRNSGGRKLAKKPLNPWASKKIDLNEYVTGKPKRSKAKRKQAKQSRKRNRK
jgi:hypothetical protein